MNTSSIWRKFMVCLITLLVFVNKFLIYWAAEIKFWIQSAILSCEMGSQKLFSDSFRPAHILPCSVFVWETSIVRRSFWHYFAYAISRIFIASSHPSCLNIEPFINSIDCKIWDISKLPKVYVVHDNLKYNWYYVTNITSWILRHAYYVIRLTVNWW